MQKKKPRNKKKKLVGPINNEINIDKILIALLNNYHGDQETLKQTTLMIKNIPIKFAQ